VGSNPTGRTTSFCFNDLCERQLRPIVCFFDRWSGMAGPWHFWPLFYPSNNLREPNSILYPLRIAFCHRNVVHVRRARRRTFGEASELTIWKLIGSVNTSAFIRT
jgi:hypothetical protein